jgi:hypothetical protein
MDKMTEKKDRRRTVHRNAQLNGTITGSISAHTLHTRATTHYYRSFKHTYFHTIHVDSFQEEWRVWNELISAREVLFANDL